MILRTWNCDGALRPVLGPALLRLLLRLFDARVSGFAKTCERSKLLFNRVLRLPGHAHLRAGSSVSSATV